MDGTADYRQVTGVTTEQKVKLHDQTESYVHKIACGDAPKVNECIGDVFVPT